MENSSARRRFFAESCGFGETQQRQCVNSFRSGCRKARRLRASKSRRLAAVIRYDKPWAALPMKVVPRGKIFSRLSIYRRTGFFVLRQWWTFLPLHRGAEIRSQLPRRKPCTGKPRFALQPHGGNFIRRRKKPLPQTAALLKQLSI